MRVTSFARSLPFSFVTTGSLQSFMLFFQCCWYRSPAAVSTVSTANSVEKMLVSLAPYPCRPPVTRSTVSSKFEPVNRCPSTSSGM